MNKVSVIMITRNEENKLKQALDSAKWADEIIIVDSGSKDRTKQIAKDYTDKVFEKDFEDFSSQKNFALGKCRNDWVLSLDADEVVTPELKEKIHSLDPAACAGYRIKRKNYIFGRLLKYGGNSKDAPLRLFNRKKAEFCQPIHEFVRIGGETGLIKEPIQHYSSQNLTEYMNKLKLYTDLEAKFMLREKREFSYLKMFFLPPARFFQKYFLQLGFLDGFAGFLFYSLSAYYEFAKWKKYRVLA